MVQWRLLQVNNKTGERRYVWATYRTKKQAQKIADGFNKLSDEVTVLVVKEEK